MFDYLLIILEIVRVCKITANVIEDTTGRKNIILQSYFWKEAVLDLAKNIK